MQGFIANSATGSRVSIQESVCMLAGMHIGERIRYAREKYRTDRHLPKLTQEALAEAVGMERGKLSLIEIGKTQNVSEGDAKALASALGVSPCWLALEMGPIEITQVGGVQRLDDALLQGILEVVLDVMTRKGLSTSPERLSRFVVKRYKEEVEHGAVVDRGEIEKILAYFD